MGFGKPKFPTQTQDRELAALQKEQLQASIDAVRNAPQLKLPEPVRFAAPPQNTAADQVAAEQMARRSMAGKKGIAYSIKPGGLGGAYQPLG